MRRARGFTVLELLIASLIFAGIVAIALAWLLHQQRFAAATGTMLAQATARPPLVTLLRQDVQSAGQVIRSWKGLISDEHTMLLAIPQDAYGYRTDQAAVVLYTRSGNRLLRSAFPNRETSPEDADSRWIGPELKSDQDIAFTYLDRECLALAGDAVTNTRMVVVSIPAGPGQPAVELRLTVRNTLP